ncbi:MAG TPA: UDP-3-O-acyl-N-acetylglucosamine deacetylase, partial [Chitinophagaceae bacterium]|nr:UDP-3-O-acyl-N-acetylglucosamine deacetylase [Chitinophagales bacterium]HMZ93650.1 UDP-3-O-acyl-N-acetylglucosamine deacetylase [Chitinophagales bacterium]HNL83553.1 UDP-3-O-acyl-N-acetylglucosamine deacetylase [Chitinophagaceae bacterium]
AVVGLQIDNLILEIEGGEVPILDGSAKYFVDKIREVGIKEEAIHKSKFIVQKNIEWKDHETNAEYLLIPSSSFSITCMIDYHSKSLGKQYASLERWADYITEIAPAKTFCFLHEIEMLYKHGLIKGGNLNNALVFSEFNIEPEKAKWLTETFNQPIFSIPEKGVLNPIYQTFDNEAARHKILDLIGDLSLLGIALQGRLIVMKPGHTSNIRFSKYLKEYIGAKIL